MNSDRRMIFPILFFLPQMLAAVQQRPATLEVAGRPCELAVTSVSPNTVRITFSPFSGSAMPAPVTDEPEVAPRQWPTPVLRVRSLLSPVSARAGKLNVIVKAQSLAVRVEREGRLIQELRIDKDTGSVSFPSGGAPVFGMGQGGPQFDRRGHIDPMTSSQEGYRKFQFGGRMPVPWLIGVAGWALFLHQPRGRFNLTGNDLVFLPGDPAAPLPIDIFVVAAAGPVEVMREYAGITGFPSLPPLWSLGYQQSHRTIEDRDEMLRVAKTFREKQLPCDVLIYLGTGFCPSGWNTGHDSFAFNPKVFPNPQQDIGALQALKFRVVLHTTRPPAQLYGTVAGPRDLSGENAAAAYWARHQPVSKLGLDGWWPDEAENRPEASRLARIRMYWDGPQLDHPNRRPFAFHRAGLAGMQRFGGWLWSGDVNSAWETLRNHIPIAINTGLSGVPFWGTDIGGFFPVREYTGELHVRWFQFGAFCPLFRAHGRTWQLRLPWGWNTGKFGPLEMPESAMPDPSELHNPNVEPIVRKYLELRYRMMPYIYSIAREAHETGLPMMRALWLHYAADPRAVERGDEFLWGRDILVAPVVEKGATSRRLYLPPGAWYDFWTGVRTEGGREVERPVDLETMPLYVRAGAIIPTGPLEQYTSEKPNDPITLAVYPGADGRFTLYEDDGVTFNFQKGEFMKLRCEWNDRERRLSLRLEPGSRMMPPAKRTIRARLGANGPVKEVLFTGQPSRLRLEAPQ